MKMYKFIILALVALLYSCGQNGGLPNSSGGSTAGDPPATSGSISFTSTDNSGIGLSGTGNVNALITFTVIDDLGSAISGATVTFTLSGPNGSESINPTSDISSDSGVVSTTLTSGNVPGPVTIEASVTLNGTVISTLSSVISIGGGVPSATHFNIAAETLNLYGLQVSGLTTTVIAFIADRYGNFNVLDGTTVSFYTEAGAVLSSDTTDNTAIADAGEASVTFKTQAPMPADVLMNSSEETDLDNLLSKYGLSSLGTGSPYAATVSHPRDGRLTVLAVLNGEEAFEDANGNGVYDGDGNGSFAAGTDEVFIDLGEPFYDKNDDGCRNNGSTATCYDQATETTTVTASTDPFEEFIDSDGDGSYDVPNGVWDGPNCPDTTVCLESKQIWDELKMAFTGNATTCAIDQANGVVITDGSSQIYNFMVSDYNLNRPIPGTVVSVTLAGGGQLFGLTTHTVPDGVPSGPYEISVTVADAAAGGTAALFSLTFEVTSDSIVTCGSRTVTGTVQ